MLFRSVRGVVAIDITLDGFSSYLAQRKVSPGSLTFILDAEGRVVASSDRTRSYANDEGRVELRHISSLDKELPSAAFSSRPRDGDRSSLLYTYHHGGKEYLVSLTDMPADLGKRWQFFVVSPVDDFTGAFNRNNQRLLLIGVAAIVLQVIIIYFLSSIISRPLERLAGNVDHIRELDAHQQPSISSAIREISSLSRAIDMLDNAVKSFSA